MKDIDDYYDEAYDQLVDELDREPTDEELYHRANDLAESAYWDYADARYEDERDRRMGL